MITRLLLITFGLVALAFLITASPGAGEQAGSVLLDPPEDPLPTASRKLTTLIPLLQFENKQVSQVLASIRAQADLNLVIDQAGLDVYAIDLGKLISIDLKQVTADEALTVIESMLDTPTAKLGHSASGNLVTLSIGERLCRIVTTRIYDIVDLIQREQARYAVLHPVPATTVASYETTADVIIKLIQETVSPESWRETGGMVGSIREWNGRLIITQTPENQARVEHLIKGLRESGKPASKPTRMGD